MPKDRIAFDRLGSFPGEETTMRDSNGRMTSAYRSDVIVWRCDECGALVNNTALHEVWHGGTVGYEQ